MYPKPGYLKKLLLLSSIVATPFVLASNSPKDDKAKLPFSPKPKLVRNNSKPIAPQVYVDKALTNSNGNNGGNGGNNFNVGSETPEDERKSRSQSRKHSKGKISPSSNSRSRSRGNSNGSKVKLSSNSGAKSDAKSSESKSKSKSRKKNSSSKSPKLERRLSRKGSKKLATKPLNSRASSSNSHEAKGDEIRIGTNVNVKDDMTEILGALLKEYGWLEGRTLWANVYSNAGRPNSLWLDCLALYSSQFEYFKSINNSLSSYENIKNSLIRSFDSPNYDEIIQKRFLETLVGQVGKLRVNALMKAVVKALLLWSKDGNILTEHTHQDAMKFVILRLANEPRYKSVVINVLYNLYSGVERESNDGDNFELGTFDDIQSLIKDEMIRYIKDGLARIPDIDGFLGSKLDGRSLVQIGKLVKAKSNTNNDNHLLFWILWRDSPMEYKYRNFLELLFTSHPELLVLGINETKLKPDSFIGEENRSRNVNWGINIDWILNILAYKNPQGTIAAVLEYYDLDLLTHPDLIESLTGDNFSDIMKKVKEESENIQK